MVNIKGFTQFSLGDTANLAGMIVPLPSSASLPLPILAIPVIGAEVTLPRWVIYTHLLLGLPFSLTGFRAEVVFASIKQGTLAVKGLTTILTDKIKLWIIVACVYPTSINRLPFVATLIRAIRMLATLDLRSLADKFLIAYFTLHNRSIA